MASHICYSHQVHASHNETIVSVGEKAGSLMAMAGMTLISSILIPLIVRKKILATKHTEYQQKGLSGCLCFGAGVLLATVFLHLLPEAHSDIEAAISDGFIPHTDFPIAEFIVCCGFFLVYLVEEAALLIFPQERGEHGTSLDVPENNRKNVICMESATIANKVTAGIDNSAFESNNDSVSRKSSILVDEVEDYRQGGMKRGESTSIFRSVIIVVAFSFHSVMEGLAIGLEEHSFDLWMLIGVICAHKLVVGFSLGMELLQEGLKIIPFICSMVTFSLCSPLGGVIGAIVISTADEETAAGTLVPTVLNGLAGGCILFVCFCEVLERERSRPHGHLVRIIALLAGFALMCGVESIPGDAC